MNNESIIKKIKYHFTQWKSASPDSVEILNSGSGSSRIYFRVLFDNDSYIATINFDIRENEAFFYLAKHFLFQNINVPRVLYISADRSIYIQQDLGDDNLLVLLKKEGFSSRVEGLYKKSLSGLWKMQSATKNLDFNHCYPRAVFDKQSVLWDLNYFKYYFLKVSGVDFDEQALEDDMQFIADTLTLKESDFFMFRDFQARNIQIYNEEPWFIDFQGGRRGPILYDVASLLFQASADLSDEIRNSLLNFYYEKINEEYHYPKQEFNRDFQLMVFVRIVQTLGAYGYRGLIEGKEYFRNSIPNALRNLKGVLNHPSLELEAPYFLSILHEIIKIKDTFEK